MTAPASATGPGRLLPKVKSRLFLRSRRRVRTVLEGEYASVFHGRSLDYVDLRAYVPGDEVRDIDWNATARHGSPLVKRYVATRKQHLLLVVDTGRGMAATTRSGELKKDVAIAIAGLLGYLAQRHGDLVGLVRGTARTTAGHPFRGAEAHLELLLRAVDGATRIDGEASDLAAQLGWVVANVRRRTVMVVVADDLDLEPRIDDLLRRLLVQHEVIWCTVADADPTAIEGGRTAYEVADRRGLPAEVRLDPRVRQAYAAAVARRVEHTATLLARRGVGHVRIDSTDDVVPAVFTLLARQRHAR